MRVLIVHYHLKPGGVSSVIRRQASALKGLGYEARVLVGEAPGVRADAAAYADIGFQIGRASCRERV